MINNIVLVGRTTKEIALKETKNGTQYAPFILAVNRPYKDEQDRQQADFIHCVAWNKTAETLAKYVAKGMMIGVEGRLQVRSYENGSPALSSEALSHPQLVGNKAGVRQYVSEVWVHRFTFLESKKSNVMPELVNPLTNTQSLITESSINYTKGIQNYDNPFATATTLAGGLSMSQNPRIVDEDLPF